MTIKNAEGELSLGFNFSKTLKKHLTKQQRDLLSEGILIGCACFCQEFKTLPQRQINFDIYSSIPNCDNNKSSENSTSNDIEEMKSNGIDETLDGAFHLSTEPFPNTLSITLRLSENCIGGFDRFFRERETPSDLVKLTQTELELRGNELLSFFDAMETILHEFSHAVSYEKMMDATNWTNLGMPIENPDYFLWDEFLAKYRSILVTLKMLPEIEDALWYSICTTQIEELSNQLKKAKENINKIKHNFEIHGFSLKELKLINKSDKNLIPQFYAFDNTLATKEGTQLIGFAQACYDFQHPDKKFALTDEEKQLSYLLEHQFHKSRIFKNFQKMKFC